MVCVEKLRHFFIAEFRKKKIENFEGLSAYELAVNLDGDNELVMVTVIFNEIVFDSPVRKRNIREDNRCFFKEIRIIQR